MDYEIIEVSSVKDNVYEGKAGIRFKVKGVEHQLSTLTLEKNKFVVGAVVHGTITSKVKDDKTFYNFNEKKSAPTASAPNADTLYISRNVDATLAHLQRIQPKLDGLYEMVHQILLHLELKPKEDIEYPESHGEPSF